MSIFKPALSVRAGFATNVFSRSQNEQLQGPGLRIGARASIAPSLPAADIDFSTRSLKKAELDNIFKPEPLKGVLDGALKESDSLLESMQDLISQAGAFGTTKKVQDAIGEELEAIAGRVSGITASFSSAVDVLAERQNRIATAEAAGEDPRNVSIGYANSLLPKTATYGHGFIGLVSDGSETGNARASEALGHFSSLASINIKIGKKPEDYSGTKTFVDISTESGRKEAIDSFQGFRNSITDLQKLLEESEKRGQKLALGDLAVSTAPGADEVDAVQNAANNLAKRITSDKDTALAAQGLEHLNPYVLTEQGDEKAV